MDGIMGVKLQAEWSLCVWIDWIRSWRGEVSPHYIPYTYDENPAKGREENRFHNQVDITDPLRGLCTDVKLIL